MIFTNLNFLCLILLHPVPIDPQATVLYVYTSQALAMAPAMSFPVIRNFNFADALSVIFQIDSSAFVEFNIPGVPTNGMSLFTNSDFETLRLNRHVLPANCKLGMLTFNEAPDDIDDPDDNNDPENSDEFTVFILLDSNNRPVYDDANVMVYRVISDNEDPFEIDQMLVNADGHLKSIFENNL